jgi:hypothetical protein
MWQSSSEDSEILDIVDEESLFCSRLGGHWAASEKFLKFLRLIAYLFKRA